MTPKEIVLDAIAFRETPRLPVAVLDGYLWMIRRLGMSFDDLMHMPDAEAIDLVLGTYDELGSDFVYGDSTAINCVRESLGGAADYSQKGQVVAVTRPAMKSLEEVVGKDAAEVFEGVKKLPRYQCMARRLGMLNDRVSEEKLIMAFSPGPMTLAASLAGVEALLMSLFDDDEVTRAALSFSANLCARMLEYQIECGATAVSIADPVASVNMISSEFFDRFFMPYFKEVTATLKKHGKPIVLHICGDTTSRLEPLKSAGIDVFSVDSIDLKPALDAVRGHYAIFGNLSPVNVLLNMSEDEVYAIAKERAAAAGRGGGFIMAPGCDLAADTPIENIKAMVRAAHGE